MASSEAEMRETTVTRSEQIRTEERWEGRYGIQEQVTISGGAGAAASVSASAAFAAGAVATGAAEVLSELSCFLCLPLTAAFSNQRPAVKLCLYRLEGKCICT